MLEFPEMEEPLSQDNSYYIIQLYQMDILFTLNVQEEKF